MNGTFEDLSDEEQALAAARARGDYIINCAMEWIGRFHMEFSGPLISQLLQGVRELTKAMHERSVMRIEALIADLLANQSRLVLFERQHSQASPSFRNTLPTSDVPRLHEEWLFREHRFVHGKDQDIQGRKGRSVFISYSRADSAFLKRVLVHLRPLERSGRIELWHDGKILPGYPWRSELDRALMCASVAVLIVSANFMASDFIYSNELQPIARRAREEGVAVFPVVFGHCLFDEDPHLDDFQLFNDPERPLSHLPPAEADAILVKLAKAIRERA